MPLLHAVLALSLSAQQARKPPAQTTKPAAKEAPKPAAPTLVERAQKAFDAQDYQTASTLLREHVTANPEDSAAWFNLAFAATALGDKKQAEEGYTKAIDLEPKMFPAQLNL